MRRDRFESFERELGEMFDRVLHGWSTRCAESDHAGWIPPFDMLEGKREIVLQADLPGLEHGDMQLSIDNGVLTLRGARQQEKEEKDEDCYAHERWSDAFSRSITLPQGVDPSRVEASFKNDGLEIYIPKTGEARGKKIEIKPV